MCREGRCQKMCGEEREGKEGRGNENIKETHLERKKREFLVERKHGKEIEIRNIYIYNIFTNSIKRTERKSSLKTSRGWEKRHEKGTQQERSSETIIPLALVNGRQMAEWVGRRCASKYIYIYNSLRFESSQWQNRIYYALPLKISEANH